MTAFLWELRFGNVDYGKIFLWPENQLFSVMNLYGKMLVLFIDFSVIFIHRKLNFLVI